MTVTVWAIIRDVCKEANIPIPTIRELDKLLDDETFRIYDEGLTCSINQADSDFATELVKAYRPRSVAEMSAFVAIIRPGCASLLRDFIDRKDYTTGVPELDDLLIEGKHRMIYQELIMKYLIWLGIPETGSYDIIKKIAKKKFKEPELAELKKKLLDGWIKNVGKEDGFEETWTVVEQAAHYSFNASHSLSYAYDSLYGAYLKSHYPLEYYTVALNYYIGDEDRTQRLTQELKHFNIGLSSIKFGKSTARYSYDRDANEIFKGIASIKYMNENVAEELHDLSTRNFGSFIDLLYAIKNETSVNTRQLKILIDLDFFSDFGDANYLNKCSEMFERYYDKKQIKKQSIEELGISLEVLKPFVGKETEKLFSDINMKGFLRQFSRSINVRGRTLGERVKAQIEHLGYVDIVGPEFVGIAVVTEVDTKYAPKLKLYSLRNGTTIDCKVDRKTFNRHKLKEGDIIRILKSPMRSKMKRTEDGDYEPIPDQVERWVTEYKHVNL